MKKSIVKLKTRAFYIKILLTCIAIIGWFFYSVYADNREIYFIDTVQIIPGSVYSDDWDRVHMIQVRDLDDYSIYQEFSHNNSASIGIRNDSIDDESSGSSTADLEATATNTYEFATTTEVGASTTFEFTEEEIEQEHDTADAHEPETVSAEPFEAFNFSHLTQARNTFYPLLVAGVTTTNTSTSMSTDWEESETSNESLYNSIGSTTSNIDELLVATTTTDVSTDIVDSSTDGSSEVATTTDNAITQYDEEDDVEAVVLPVEEVNQYVLTLERFGLPLFDEETTIAGAQMRISFAARPYSSNTVTQSLAMRYRFADNEPWQMGGSILLDDEVSNGLNGGYFLFGMPENLDGQALDSLVIQLVYEGDIAYMHGVYLESAWLEVFTVGRPTAPDGGLYGALLEDDGYQKGLLSGSVLETQNRTLEFNHVVAGTGEGLEFATLGKSSTILEQDMVHFSITNASNAAADIVLGFNIHDNDGTIAALRRWEKNTPRTVRAPEVRPFVYHCEAGWQSNQEISGIPLSELSKLLTPLAILEALALHDDVERSGYFKDSFAEIMGANQYAGYYCRNTSVTRFCDEFSEDNTGCQVNDVISQEHILNTFTGSWITKGLDIPGTRFETLLDRLSAFFRRSGQVVTEIETMLLTTVPGQDIHIAPGETQYFALEIESEPFRPGTIEIAAFGETVNGSMRHSWDSEWRRVVPMRVSEDLSAETKAVVAQLSLDETDEWFWEVAGEGARNLRIGFTNTASHQKKDWKELPFWIQHIDTVGQIASVWIRLPENYSNTTSIAAFFAKDGASRQSFDRYAVFGSGSAVTYQNISPSQTPTNVDGILVGGAYALLVNELDGQGNAPYSFINTSYGEQDSFESTSFITGTDFSINGAVFWPSASLQLVDEQPLYGIITPGSELWTTASSSVVNLRCGSEFEETITLSAQNPYQLTNCGSIDEQFAVLNISNPVSVRQSVGDENYRPAALPAIYLSDSYHLPDHARQLFAVCYPQHGSTSIAVLSLQGVVLEQKDCEPTDSMPGVVRFNSESNNNFYFAQYQVRSENKTPFALYSKSVNRYGSDFYSLLSSPLLHWSEQVRLSPVTDEWSSLTGVDLVLNSYQWLLGNNPFPSSATSSVARNLALSEASAISNGSHFGLETEFILERKSLFGTSTMLSMEYAQVASVQQCESNEYWNTLSDTGAFTLTNVAGEGVMWSTGSNFPNLNFSTLRDEEILKWRWDVLAQAVEPAAGYCFRIIDSLSGDVVMQNSHMPYLRTGLSTEQLAQQLTLNAAWRADGLEITIEGQDSSLRHYIVLGASDEAFTKPIFSYDSRYDNALFEEYAGVGGLLFGTDKLTMKLNELEVHAPIWLKIGVVPPGSQQAPRYFSAPVRVSLARTGGSSSENTTTTATREGVDLVDTDLSTEQGQQNADISDGVHTSSSEQREVGQENEQWLRAQSEGSLIPVNAMSEEASICADSPQTDACVVLVQTAYAWEGSESLFTADGVFLGLTANDQISLRLGVQQMGTTMHESRISFEYAPKSITETCEALDREQYVPVPVSDTNKCQDSDICLVTDATIPTLVRTPSLHRSLEQYTFTAGSVLSNDTAPTRFYINTYTEFIGIIHATEAAQGEYCIRPIADGELLSYYSKIPVLSIQEPPAVTDVVINDAYDIGLMPGTTTPVVVTAIVSDENGYQDITQATTTLYRSGVARGVSCSEDPNNCYISSKANNQCSLSDCTSSQCLLTCTMYIQYHADPTDRGVFEGEEWFAFVEVRDRAGNYGFASSQGVDILSLQAITITSGIEFIPLAPGENTGDQNAVTKIMNIGNTEVYPEIQGVDMTDGHGSVIPAKQQKLALQPFVYGECMICRSLQTGTVVAVDTLLPKPLMSGGESSLRLYWGISIPEEASRRPHYGSNIFYAASP